ncbi:hypothetical protein [Tenacibaculum sp. UWU-22]|uniref:hypothetical protein n=1 Tax=Tenacibaculum sp. UWU-22 TaxID=3234187 RepID=UPI0034DB3610
MKKKKQYIFISLLCLVSSIGLSQNLDIESITKSTKVKVNGNVNANMVYYNANTRNARIPFTYFLQGTVNVSWLSFNVPFTYSFSNQGENFDYQLPFNFNKLSLHPRYKWVQAHIGDVTMNFSPYTLNGYQFTGGGVELTPQKSPLKFSAMYGRLLKATEDDGNPKTVPAFKRMGYGAKVAWKKPKYKVGLIGFYAKDAEKSITAIPEERNIKPKENLAISLTSETTIAKKYTVRAEYASTAITQDLRADKSSNNANNLAGFLFNNRTSTEYYNALKADLDIKLGQMKVGLGYERIDPNYQTLGAYYFNNDFENITLNMTRSLFKNKLNLSFNIGYQRDNLNNQKAQSTGRNVGSINATYQMNDAVTLSGSYSNFTTFTNKSLNQFDDINDNDLTDEEQEALDFKQLSQNANVNLSWMLVKKKYNTQNINLSYALFSSANKENGIIRIGQANNFHNANAVYTLGFPERALSISPSLNYNYSDIGRDDSQAWGASLNISKLFFKNKFNTTLGSSYNMSENKNINSAVLNIRASASTTIAKKHNFNLNAVQLFRATTNQKKLEELTVTFGYSYAFGVKKPKLKFNKREKNKKLKEFEFSYKNYTFKGEHSKITSELTQLLNDSMFVSVKSIEIIRNNLSLLETDVVNNENASNKHYKRAAIRYLDYLYKYKNFIDIYHKLVFKSLKKLYNQAVLLGEKVKVDYVRLSSLVKEQGGIAFVSEQDKKNLKTRELKMKAHNWMQSQLKGLSYQDIVADKGSLKTFKNNYIAIIFKMIEEKKTDKEIEDFLVVEFAAFYHKKALFIINEKQ